MGLTSSPVYRMPAEWEPHRATWISWPHHEPDWPGKLAPIRVTDGDMKESGGAGRLGFRIRDGTEQYERRRLSGRGKHGGLILARDFLETEQVSIEPRGTRQVRDLQMRAANLCCSGQAKGLSIRGLHHSNIEVSLGRR